MEGNKVFNIRSKITKDSLTEDPVKIFYNQYVSIIKQIIGITNKQSEVLSELLYQNYLLKDKINDSDFRWRAVFDSQNRKVMQSNIEVPEKNFSNCLTDLRKKNILKGHQIIDNLVVYPKIKEDAGAFVLAFKFTIDGADV